jgi:hypothetical protein
MLVYTLIILLDCQLVAIILSLHQYWCPIDLSSQMLVSVLVPIFGLVSIVKFCWKAHFYIENTQKNQPLKIIFE